MKNLWFTSDTHFHHKNILKHCPQSRGHCESVERMNEEIISNWNNCVRADDSIIHLGDVSFSSSTDLVKTFSRLNGHKTLVCGNHDKKLRESGILNELFDQVLDYHELSHEGQHIVLSHYPLLTWNRIARGAWMLHGHCHGNMQYPFTGGKICDVGVDCWNLSPVSFKTIQKFMANREIVALDHH